MSAEKSRSCSLSTLMRTTALMLSRPLRSEQNDSTSPEAETQRAGGQRRGLESDLSQNDVRRREQTLIAILIKQTTSRGAEVEEVTTLPLL